MASEIQKELNELKIKTGLTDEEIKRKEKLNKLKEKLLRSKGSYTQPMFISQVNYLLGIIKGANQLPGRDVYERYEELAGEFEKLKLEYKSKE